MTVRRTNCYEQALACDQFDKFCNANNLKDILQHYQNLCRTCSLSPTNFPEFYPKIKAKLPSRRANELWAKLDKRASHPSYGRGTFCSDNRVLVIGGGPCGLRTAIEAQLLGAKTVVVEKRDNYIRNNVLHLWPFSITDLKNLGAKIFYGKFCAGSIDHISIRQLQCILLKIALLIGVEFHSNVTFDSLIEPESQEDDGWKANFLPKGHPVSHFNFDVVIGADGRQCTLGGFHRKALRAKLAIAITANFIHNHTEAEARVQEISGVNYIFRQQFFQELDQAMGIALENIVYYKDETHYFVMTPTKQSLLEKGVLYQDFPDPEQLLCMSNVDPEALQLFTMEAVVFACNNQLPNLQFATNSRGEPDVAIFDFTTMYASENSCRAVERKGHKLLLGLVGDSLLEPFWPTGTGIARGFLASFDAAWMIRSWGKGLKSVCEVLAERESIHRVLAQATHENLNKDHNQYAIDPSTRYAKINFSSVGARQVKNLFDSDEGIKDIFLSIRDSKRCRLVSEAVILSWFQEQLSHLGITVDSVLDIFSSGEAIIGIVKRYRNDLVEQTSFQQEEGGGVNVANNNECAFQILNEEYNIPIVFHGESSADVTPTELPKCIEYLSQIYNVFKGEIPKPIEQPKQAAPDQITTPEKNTISNSYPDNSALHHNLSIKQFLTAKEHLAKKKIQDDAQFKQRSALYESMLLNGTNPNQPKSTNSANIPVVAKLKINPVSPGDLFSACRNGSDREKSSTPKIPSGDTMSMIRLARSRSDVGYKNKGFGLPPQSSTTIFRNGQPRDPQNSQKLNNRPSELEEVQFRIRKSKTMANPLGDICSTFLGRHINQNSGCTSNEEQSSPDENPLSCERRRLLKKTRPRSVYQNLNDSSGAYYYPEEEDQENCEEDGREREQSTNPFFNNYEQDPGFKERCKFLEKRLYNSGRDIKVHIGAAWFQKAEEKEKQKKNKSNPNFCPSSAENSLEKSPSSGSTPGFLHPLKRGSSFNVRNKMEESFNSDTTTRNPRQTTISNRAKVEREEFNPKALFLEKRLKEMAASRHPPPSFSSSYSPFTEWRSDEKSPSPKPKNDHHNSHHFHYPNQRQQSGTRKSDLKMEQQQQNNKDKSQKDKKIGGISSVADSDLDCFLNGIDFKSIDGQDLQELLSSY